MTSNDVPIDGHRIKMYPSGHYVDPFDLKVDDVCLDDIVHHLSQICRYQGGTGTHYSVGEHSVYVSLVVERHTKSIEVAMAALFHDAAEAYLGDVPGPMKHRLEYDFFREAEARALRVIAEALDIDPDLFEHPVVCQVDREILFYEMAMFRDHWREPLSGPQVRDRFLSRYHLLGGTKWWAGPMGSSR